MNKGLAFLNEGLIIRYSQPGITIYTHEKYPIIQTIMLNLTTPFLISHKKNRKAGSKFLTRKTGKLVQNHVYLLDYIILLLLFKIVVFI